MAGDSTGAQVTCRLITKLPARFRVPDAVLVGLPAADPAWRGKRVPAPDSCGADGAGRGCPAGAVPDCQLAPGAGCASLCDTAWPDLGSLGAGADAAEPFDFLVEGQLLRTSLQALLQARKLSTVRCALRADRRVLACAHTSQHRPVQPGERTRPGCLHRRKWRWRWSTSRRSGRPSARTQSTAASGGPGAPVRCSPGRALADTCPCHAGSQAWQRWRAAWWPAGTMPGLCDSAWVRGPLVSLSLWLCPSALVPDPQHGLDQL